MMETTAGGIVTIKVQLQYTNDVTSLVEHITCDSDKSAMTLRDALNRQISQQINAGNEYILIGVLKTTKDRIIAVLDSPLYIRRSNIMGYTVTAGDLPGSTTDDGSLPNIKRHHDIHTPGFILAIVDWVREWSSQFKDAD